MKLSISFDNHIKRNICLPILFLLIIFIIFSSTVLVSSPPYARPFSFNRFFADNQTFVNRTQPNIIIPTFLRSNYVEILDFVLHQHSIYLSGRRHSWTWSDIYCLFANSNKSVHGTIDRRSDEPFVVCPLTSFEQYLILNGSSNLRLSLLIHDKTFPNNSLLLSNITIPIYHRNRYNISIYTMIRDKTEVLIEWIEYHRLIGVEHFYLYDHFSNDSLDYFLRSYLERQIVTIVRWPYNPLKGHYWNMMQSASMNHALKNFGPFNRWMGYFDVDEYFQIIDRTELVNSNSSLADLLDQKFPESAYHGGVQFLNCPISCFVNEVDLASSRYQILFEKCRHIHSNRDCHTRTKMFIRPQNIPIMQNIHALQYGVNFAYSSQSSSFAQFRHYHYGVMLTNLSKDDRLDTSMDIFIPELKKRIITYLVKPVSNQPYNTYHLNNVFTPLTGENVLKLYECEQGCSKCCGPKSYVAITNTRVITRTQGTKGGLCSCCCCCCEGPHIDTAIYLRDIEVLTESKPVTMCCACNCCTSCCGDIPKYIAVKGGFGLEYLTFKKPEAIAALNELSAIIQPFKEK